MNIVPKNQLIDGAYYEGFEGDLKGYVLTVDAGLGRLTLIPGEYRTYSLHHWDENQRKLELRTLD